MAENLEFWEIVGLEEIIKFLDERKLNYLIYCLGEARAASVDDKSRPIVLIELHPQVDRMKVMRYFATYQLFSMHLESQKI